MDRRFDEDDDGHLAITIENRGMADAWVLTSLTRLLEPEPGTSDVLVGFDDAFVDNHEQNFQHFFFPLQERIAAGATQEVQTGMGKVSCMLTAIEDLADPEAPGEVVTNRPDRSSSCIAAAPPGLRLVLNMIPNVEHTLRLSVSVFDRPIKDHPELSVNPVPRTANEVQLGLVSAEFPPAVSR